MRSYPRVTLVSRPTTSYSAPLRSASSASALSLPPLQLRKTGFRATSFTCETSGTSRLDYIPRRDVVHAGAVVLKFHRPVPAAHSKIDPARYTAPEVGRA